MDPLAANLPVPLAQLPTYIEEHPDHTVSDLVDPYIKYEAGLRQLYAQDPENKLVQESYANVLPLFGAEISAIKTRARDVALESKEEQDKYIMSLPPDKRRPTGSPAVADSINEFQSNFAVFSESALADMDWSNVVAAGSSVVNCLLPVPKQFKISKRALRHYYHDLFCPASDVDLFLYGLSEEEAIEKIKQIERCISDSILTDITTVRTKHAVTICSQYPTRHVQVVLRIYKNVSEILTGFDVDCSAAAYDGKQVYVTPRALASYITQVNHIDLTRRSPSYENRLSKYSHRNFEVYWPDLNRSQIDPTIFERHFARTVGLARLLVLEQLPTVDSREQYSDKRKRERGRPVKYRGYQHNRYYGNIKNRHEDEIAEWIVEDEISSYHTFSLPYGKKYHARKIEKLCYTKDLLLNAEWNQKDRLEMNLHLHRHPAFFGRVEDVINDCCGNCPKPRNKEEAKVAKKEAEVYISGKITFLKDDPGRQQIGSFNPLTEDDWTEMAYVGNTTRLCQAIVDRDLEAVKSWLSQDDADPNRRDHTGRTPLHLAVMSSNPEVVRCLVDNGARLVARLADGRTALHLAAQRGDSEIVKIIMDRSVTNEEAEKQRIAENGHAKVNLKDKKSQNAVAAETNSGDSTEQSDGELVNAEFESDDDYSMATGSFVKVRKDNKIAEDGPVPDEDQDEPDYYNINVLAWDAPLSALHLAILAGNFDVVRQLCNDYGANQLLPIKIVSDYNLSKVILTLVLALTLPKDKAIKMADTLVELGASCSQADFTNVTSFHRYVRFAPTEQVMHLWEKDQISARTALNHLAINSGNMWSRPNPTVLSPLVSAVHAGDPILVLKLLDSGAKTEIQFEDWLAAMKGSGEKNQLGTDLEANKRMFRQYTYQPLVAALYMEDLDTAVKLIQRGADINLLTMNSYETRTCWFHQRKRSQAYSILDVVRNQIVRFKKYDGPSPIRCPMAKFRTEEFIEKFPKGSWRRWVVTMDVASTRKMEAEMTKKYEDDMKNREKISKDEEKKKAAIEKRLAQLEQLEALLLSKGAKTYPELFPDFAHRSAEEKEEVAPNVKTQPNEYEFDFKFLVKDCTEARNEAYVNLFEAAWSGDDETIKNLTLKPWGEEKKEPPLEIAIQNTTGSNPFSLAFSRGHYSTARTVLEIAEAQYSPIEQEETRYIIDSGDSDNGEYSYQNSDAESCDESEAGRDLKISEHIVQNKFTIDNVGEISMKVESHIKPLTIIKWEFPLQRPEDEFPVSPDFQKGRAIEFCFKYNDMKALNFILETGREFVKHKLPGEAEYEQNSLHLFTVSDREYESAIRSGQISLLTELIRKTGAGMPLEYLVKKSGVEMESKSRYYRGLTVYGKKRTDWATAGRSTYSVKTGDKNPPLLEAALAGRIESVEWYLSDLPARSYLQWCNSNSQDPRLQHLRKSGGYKTAIDAWLGADNIQVLLSAVMGPPGDKTNDLIKYLIKAYPSSLEARTRKGYTPLALAFYLGRYQFAKILIEAGANQNTRTEDGETLVHLTLAHCSRTEALHSMLKLLDPDLRSEMMTQRTKLSANGLTPLHWFVLTRQFQSFKHDSEVKFFKLLLDFKSYSGKELGMFNGAGDTVMHTLVKKCKFSVAKILAKEDPSLIYREDAVGRTPIEVAEDSYFRNVIDMDKLSAFNPLVNFHGTDWDLTIQSPQSFTNRDKSSHDNGISCSPSAITWQTLRACQSKYPVKPRRLVALHEANDVANRLSNRYASQRWVNTVFSRNNLGETAAQDCTLDEKEKRDTNEKAPRVDLIDAKLINVAASTAWKEFDE